MAKPAVYQPKIYVIVVGWNNRDLLEECFDSVYKQSYKNWEIILVDNGSKDDSVEYVLTNHPDIHLIEAGENLGFAVANNVAISKAFEDPSCKYIALLNTDARIREDWLEKIVAFAEKHPKGFSFQSPTLDYYDHSILDSCGIVVNHQALAIQLGYRYRHFVLKDAKVFGVNAAACLYSRAFLDAQPFGNDYFDSDFFMYLEDVDIATRAVMMGWTSHLVNESEAYHMGSASSGKNPGFSLYMTYRNNALVMVKNFPFKIILKTLPGMVRAEVGRLRGFYRDRQFSLLRAMIKGRFVSLGLILPMLRKRQILKRKWNIDNTALWDIMQIPKIKTISPQQRPIGTDQVGVVILANNDQETIENCVNSVLAQTHQLDKIIIVENGSTDGTWEVISKRFAAITSVRSENNLGVANGYNTGILSHIKNRPPEDHPDYFLLIRGNSVLANDWLMEVIKPLRDNKKISAGSGVYSYLPGSFPTEITTPSRETVQNVVGISDQACLVDRKLIDKVGLFDGHFFDKFEDLDLSFRARLYGEESVVSTKAISYQKVKPTTENDDKRVWYQSRKNLYFLYLKNLPVKLFLRYLPGAIVFAAKDIELARKNGLLLTTLKAYTKAIMLTPRMLIYRKRIHKHRVARAVTVHRWIQNGSRAAPNNETIS
jgi:GT2 family glycosyltransferase